MMDKVINSARHANALGLTRSEIMGHLVENGATPEDAFLAISAAKVLENDSYTCVLGGGNRTESCVQTGVSR